MGKGEELPCRLPGAPISPNLYVFPKLEAFGTPSFWVCMEDSLQRPDYTTGHWPLVSELNLQPHPLPEFQASNGLVGFPGN